MIEFTRAEGASVARVSVVDDGATVGGGWRVLRLPRAGRIVVDTRTPAYAGDDAAGPAAHDLDRVLDRALTELDMSEREMVAATFAVATRVLPSAPWVAGLLRCATNLNAVSLRVRSD